VRVGRRQTRGERLEADLVEERLGHRASHDCQSKKVHTVSRFTLATEERQKTPTSLAKRLVVVET
jgi:hypothetical protein